MTPVTQTKVVIKNSECKEVVRGNCYAAAIASIIDLPISEVPNVEVFFHIEGTFWLEIMLAFLNSKGWDLITNNQFKVYHDGKWGTGEGQITDRTEALTYCRNKYYLVSGEGPRGCNHICIYQNGKMVHDPHPSREGLAELEYFQEIIPLIK